MYDTNTAAFRFLCENSTRALIEAAIDERMELFTYTGLIEELAPGALFARRREIRRQN
jgi:hypothetical protein